MIAGDTHMNPVHIVDTLFTAARDSDTHKIFVVGDFGYWPRKSDGQWFLDAIDKVLPALDATLYFLDGNHEDHHALRDLQDRNEDSEGFWRIRENVRYAPRGHRWTWNDVDFLSLGGAFSIDRNWRRVGESFFFEETIDPEDVERAKGDKVNIMLTHDVPAGIDIERVMIANMRYGFHKINESYRNTMYVREVLDNVHPELLIHGHYHLKYQQVLDNDYTTVVGLSCDGSAKQSYVILDLDDYKTR